MEQKHSSRMGTPMYPRNLGYAVSKLSGYHRNTFRIESTTAQTASAGRIITVNLPENAIIDLHSFRWVIQDAVTNYQTDSAVAGNAIKAYLPQGNLLISRLEVLVNGVQITQGCTEYNTAFKLLRNARMNSTKSQSIDFALQNANMGSASTSTATFNAVTVGQDIQMIISDWLGFLEAPSTRFIDTGLVGMITIRITLAGNNVLTPAYITTAGGATFVQPGGLAGTTTALVSSMNYTLNNFYFTVDAISINDGMYDALLREKLSHDGFLTINYDEYYSFIQDSNSTSSLAVRFAVSSQSINKIYGTLRNTTYTSGGAGVVADSSAYNADPIIPVFFNFKSYANDNTLKWNFAINNVYHPQYLAGELEGLNQLIMTENKGGFDKDLTGNLITSFNEYRNNKFCVGIRLNHPIDGETRNQYISGFDSRGTNAQLLWQMQSINGLGGAVYCAYVLVNTTNTLRIGLGRSVELIS